MEIAIKDDYDEYRKIKTVTLTENINSPYNFAQFTVTIRKEFPTSSFGKAMINWPSIGEQTIMNTIWFNEGMNYAIKQARKLERQFTGKK